MRFRGGNCLTLKTPKAALAASLFVLGATAAHGANVNLPFLGNIDLPTTPPAAAPAPAAPAAGADAAPANATGTLPPIGVQPVPDTPVASLPSHADHAAIVTPSPQPGIHAKALSAAATPSYSREWVVSRSGNDSGDGSDAQPLKTLSAAIGRAGPGEVIRVKAGTYPERIVIGANAKAGSDGKPITLQGEGSPRVIPGGGSGALVQVRRPHWIIDGFNLDVQGQNIFGVAFEGNVAGSTLANSELHHGGGGAGVTTFNKATGAIIENNHIHNFVRTTGNKDSHGIVVQPTSKNITVRNNDVHDNSGDSVQCLGPEGFSSLPPADGLLVENNHFYANRENAVDIKTCYGVVVRNNRMHQFRPTSTAKGDVVVVHYSASNVMVEDNEIYDGAKGISVGGNHEGPVPSGIVIRRNRIHDITSAGGGEGTGIRLENSKGTIVVNNTITRANSALIMGHGTGGATQSPVIRNNILDAPVAIDMGGQAPGLKLGHNLLSAGGQCKKDGVVMAVDQFMSSAGDTSSASGSADLGEGFSPGALAVDKGVDVGLPFCGAAPEIGAVELGC
ncbi:right-handed parallel beta-helix repeat-containing protein [Myxococcus sp. K15C18031901]|uniref:right-handed parallel beta-helix repeat-containing protein n=1 Tax=Myxococcus dinghuensis TaxID=2906761 RepID=UPI0020A709DA|nr:right-handed parallel beta-helix repeat-containing protein [Myxococcus dinghuensis]MCP3101240.1 right-handed parallel beta-helix repeat-containing protein [Myxococcus dinghuensis]